MKIVAIGVGIVSLVIATSAQADNTCTSPAPQTWGAAPVNVAPPVTTPEDTTPVGRARDLLSRAKLLDEAAAADEKASSDAAARLPTLRATAKAARDKADRASGDDREILASRAEDLEADLAVTEAEVTSKKKSAMDNRRIARDLRQRAVKIVKDDSGGVDTSSMCNPPFHYTADGRKIYRIECLK